ncbi:MAG: hypothetical protein DHS20C11_17920 [Lysobacteraceae bacterium]|nr:MAG: hypothetical protein DHS20C11_17920 [Xanthomonadaceae bacterium]
MSKQKKLRLLPSLIIGALAISNPADAEFITDKALSYDGSANATMSVPAGESAQFIVKFRDVKSFDGEIKDLRKALSRKAASASDLKNLVELESKALEATLLQESQSRVQTLAAKSGMKIAHERWVSTGADLISVDTKSMGMSLKDIEAALESMDGVEYVDFNARMYPMFTPNDPSYSSQWHYFESTAGMNLPDAWDVSTGSGAVVAVLDTGHRPHNDLAGNIIGGYDFVSSASSARDGNGRDSNAEDEGDWVASANECYSGSQPSNSSWHGTHVSGTVAAVTNNNNGVAGVAFNASLLSVRVLAKCGGSLADIADAIIWASGGSVSGVPSNSNPADAINMSLGGGGSCDSTYQSAINTAVNNGTAVVVAAGNENQNASNSRPANCSNVITVAALDRQGNRAYYSNYGSVIDVSAPGGETQTSSNGVLSTLNSGSTTPSSDSYAYYQGTSMATPHVAGLAALMMSDDPSMTPAQVESTMKSSARAIPGSCSGGCGSGLVDAAAALGGSTPPPPPPGGGELDNGVTVGGISGSTGSWTHYTIDLPSGATNLSVVMSGGSGDADLYTRDAAQPTTSSYDCRPYQSGNSESCSDASPSAGTYYVSIRAYSTFSGVSLTASWDDPAPPPPPPPPGGGDLGNGDSVTGLSGSTGNWDYYTVEIPSGATDLVVTMSGGTGDADLYVRSGSQPTTSSYDCRPYLNGNNETCTIATPTAGTYHIGLRAYSSYSGVTLSVSWNEGTPPPSGGGGTVNNISATTGNWKHYTLTVPAGMGSLDVDISGGSGDGDLYVRFGSQPTTSSYDCRPYKNGNNESCSFNNPAAGTWHISIRAYSTFSGVTLDAYYNP